MSNRLPDPVVGSGARNTLPGSKASRAAASGSAKPVTPAASANGAVGDAAAPHTPPPTASAATRTPLAAQAAPQDLIPRRFLNPPAPRSVPAGSLRYARFLAATDVEGPGRRAALWLQGCSIRCPGCFNPHLWSTRGGQETPTATEALLLVEQALQAGSRGLTLLGGEPFEQAAAAAVVASTFRSAGLGVMTFTGYTYPDLQRWAQDRADIAALLEATDLLADGPYLADRPDRIRPWVGSTNQGLRALTERYRGRIPGLGPVPGSPQPGSDGGDRLEVRVAPDGTVTVNGWAETAALEHLLEGLSRPAPARRTETSPTMPSGAR